MASRDIIPVEGADTFTLEDVANQLDPIYFMGTQWTVSVGTASKRGRLMYLYTKKKGKYQYVMRVDIFMKRVTGGNRLILGFGEGPKGNALSAAVGYSLFDIKHVYSYHDGANEPLIAKLNEIRDPNYFTKVVDTLNAYIKKHHRSLLPQTLAKAKAYIEDLNNFGEEPAAGDSIDVEEDEDDREDRVEEKDLTSDKALHSQSRNNNLTLSARARGMTRPAERSSITLPSFDLSHETGMEEVSAARMRCQGGGEEGSRSKKTCRGGPGPAVPLWEYRPQDGQRTENSCPKTFSQAFKNMTEQDMDDKIARLLRDHCPHQQNPATISLNCIYPPSRDPTGDLSPFQIRHISPSFLASLTRRMDKNFKAFAGTAMLLVDSAYCKTMEDFEYHKRNSYKYWAIGGNHSICARADLALEKLNFDTYGQVDAFVLVGMLDEDARFLAWTDHADTEYRSKLSTIDRIIYIHNEWVEQGKTARKLEFKRKIAEAIYFEGYGLRDDSVVLNTFDNHFQLAFRTGKIWKSVFQVFKKYEAGTIKDQKLEGPQQKVKDMTLSSNWQSMQGIYDESFILEILGKVLNDQFSFADMASEFTRYKIGLKIEDAFCQELGCATFEECRKLYEDFGYTVEGKWQFFIHFAEQCTLDSHKRKVKRGEEEEDVELISCPPAYPKPFTSYPPAYPKPFQIFCRRLKAKKDQAQMEKGKLISTKY